MKDGIEKKRNNKHKNITAHTPPDGTRQQPVPSKPCAEMRGKKQKRARVTPPFRPLTGHRAETGCRWKCTGLLSSQLREGTGKVCSTKCNAVQTVVGGKNATGPQHQKR